jgi:two-component system chemotaxis response regulator CheB
MIRVLIVDDSPVVSQMLSYILSSDPSINVIGIATEGEDAIRMVARKKPDLVTMDINMPVMDGFEATRKIMETTPVPIVIASSAYDPKEVATSFRALEVGALAILEKPVGIGHPHYEAQSRHLINTVKAMSEVKVVTRRRRIEPAVSAKPEIAPAFQEIKVIALGASTGGPPVLQTILSGLPKDIPVPVMIVQHISQGFTSGFASWLSEVTGFQVRMPENGENSEPGKVYIAPDNVHMVVDSAGHILLNNDPPDNGLRPSVSHLFGSVAKVYRDKAAGALLTGMGKDGAHELKMMRDAGAVTFAQDQASSVVFGMPGEAVNIGAAKYVLSPEAISGSLVQLMRRSY